MFFRFSYYLLLMHSITDIMDDFRSNFASWAEPFNISAENLERIAAIVMAIANYNFSPNGEDLFIKFLQFDEFQKLTATFFLSCESEDNNFKCTYCNMKFDGVDSVNHYFREIRTMTQFLELMYIIKE